jgi:hypothetical protein
MLLQAYHGISDAEAVELSVVDLRWQMLLDRLGTTEPPFSQGARSDFRARLIEHDMDRRLLESSTACASSPPAPPGGLASANALPSSTASPPSPASRAAAPAISA